MSPSKRVDPFFKLAFDLFDREGQGVISSSDMKIVRGRGPAIIGSLMMQQLAGHQEPRSDTPAR